MNFFEVTLYNRFRGTILSWTVGAALPVCTSLFLVVFFTDSWSKTVVHLPLYVTSGLWRRCDHTDGHRYCRSLLGTEETSVEFIASQGFHVLSLFFLIMASIATFAYLLIQRFQRDKRVAITITCFLFTSVFFGSVGCATFSAGDRKDMEKMLPNINYVYYYWWGFGVIAACNIMTCFLGLLMTIEIAKSRNMIPA